MKRRSFLKIFATAPLIPILAKADVIGPDITMPTPPIPMEPCGESRIIHLITPFDVEEGHTINFRDGTNEEFLVKKVLGNNNFLVDVVYGQS